MAAPTGFGAFLFTDIVGSMRLWHDHAAAMPIALARHDQIVTSAAEAHGGRVFSPGGDGFGVWFPDAASALSGARQIAGELVAEPWPEGLSLEVRQGIHRGDAHERNDNWFGQTVNLAARVCGAAHGGQILLTDDVAESCPDADLLFLGLFELRGAPNKLGLHQHDITCIFPPPNAIDPTRDTLPEPPNILIGRGREVGELRRLIEDNRLVTVTGLGGAGKTRLTIEVAHRMRPHFGAGVYFADLSSVHDREAMVNEIAAATRLELLGGDLREQAIDQVSSQPALLLLDNCEHLVDEVAEFCTDVLSRRGPGRILATSRERLPVDGSQHVRLAPLDTTNDEGIDECMRLFVDRALSVDAHFEVGDEAALAELVTRLDGLPLAIELAAARTSVMSVPEILARIEDRLTLLSPTRSSTTRTLRAMLDWSWQLLDADERRTLAVASVFDGPFDRALLAATSGIDDLTLIELLESLVDKSLVAIDGRLGSTTRYRLLESVRSFAIERLAHDDADTEAVMANLARAVLERIRSTGEPFVSASSTPNRVLAADAANVLEAFDWAVAQPDPTLAAELALHGTNVFMSVGRAVEALAMLRRVEQRDDLASAWAGRCRFAIAMASIQCDDFGTAIATAESLVDDPDPFVRAGCLAVMAVPGMFENHAETDSLVEACLAACKLVDDPGILPAIVDGFRWFSRLDMERTVSVMAPAVPATPQTQSTLETMLTCGHALSLTLLGRFDEAADALDRQRPDDSVWDSSEMLRGALAARRGDVAAAEAILVAAGEQAMLGQLRRQANDVMIGFATLAAAEGDLEHAKQLLLDALLPRQIYVLGLAVQVADELDMLEEYLVHTAQVRADQGDTRFEANDALRAELARRR